VRKWLRYNQGTFLLIERVIKIVLNSNGLQIIALNSGFDYSFNSQLLHVNSQNITVKYKMFDT